MMADPHGAHSGRSIIEENKGTDLASATSIAGRMPMQKKISGLIILVLLVIFAWSPWITQEAAFHMAETQFNEAWNGIIDGCGTAWNDFGARDFRKIPFGAMLTLEYQCGLVMPGEPPLQTEVYMSFFNVAFGYPAP